MKHAAASTLQAIAPLLDALRALPGLTEHRPGIFHLRSAAFLHFHEDPAGLFADVKLDRTGFERLPVNTREERKALLRKVESALGSSSSARARRAGSLSAPAQFIEVKVKPNAATSVLRQEPGGAWLAQLREPPVDGKANAELIALVARHFGCRKSAVSIKSGASGRTKRVKIESP